MTTTPTYIGIDVVKDRLDVAYARAGSANKPQTTSTESSMSLLAFARCIRP